MIIGDPNMPQPMKMQRHHQPETIGLAILSAVGVTNVTLFTVGTATVTLAAVVGYVALTGVLIGLQMLLPRPGMPKQDGSQALRQPIPPRNGAYGRVRLGGYFMLYEATSDGISYDVMALVSGRIGGIVGYYLHEDFVTVNEDGIVQPFEDGRYGDNRVRIETRIGLPTETHYSLITDVLESDIWSENHRGDGIASAMVRCSTPKTEKIQEIFPSGLPEPSFVVDAYPVWDPRDNGGSPAQLREDPNTWQVSTNPVIQLIDYLTHPDHGMALDYDTLIAPVIDEWMEEADLCDEIIARKEGTQKRYESNGWWTFDTKPESVIGSLLATCDGWLTERGDGALALKIGVYRAPTDPRKIIKAKHILAFAVNYGVADEERVNEIPITFISPEHRYKETQVDPWRDEADISESGVVRSQAIDFSWVQSHPQARRLAKRTMARLKPTMQGSFVTTLYGLAVLGERWVRVQYPFVAGLEDAIVEIQKADVDLMSGRITFEWVKIDPDTIDAWDPATEEGDPPPVPEILGNVGVLPPENIDAQFADDVLVVDFDTMASPGGLVFRFRVRYRPVGQDAWTTTNILDAEDIGGGRMRINAGTVPDTQIEVQVQTVAPSGASSAWAPEPPEELSTGGAIPGSPLVPTAEDQTGGVARISWINPNSPTMYAARVYLGTNPPPDGGTTLVAGPLYGAPNQNMLIEHTPGAGSHTYWVTAANTADQESTPAGPANVTVT